MMKRCSRQFDDKLSGFGRQSEKFSRIGACIRRNFTPCDLTIIPRNIVGKFPISLARVAKIMDSWLKDT